jgi:HAD superfamily hydrolase (TIGR01662 family)
VVAGHRPNAVLFDAGGTLILQDPEEMSARLGSPIDAVAAHRAHYVAMAEFSDRRIQGHDLDWDWWLERYFDLLGVAEPHLAGQRIDRGYGLWNHPLDGVAEAIAAIRRGGIRVAVVSNSDGSVTESLARAGLADLFEFVIDSHDVGVAKPDPQIFEAALERMGVDPAQAWYVGDSVFHDVNGALAASMAKAVLVDPYTLGPEDVVKVRTVTELIFLTGSSEPT